MRARRALVAFFLRAYFLRPMNHPVLPVAVVIILFLGALRSMERTHVAMVVYFTVLAGATAGVRAEAGRFVRNLPLARGALVHSYLAAGLIHALVCLAVLGPMLWHVVKLPNLQFLETVEGTDDAGRPALFVRGTYHDGRGLPSEVNMLLPRSPLVETLRLVPRSRPMLALYYVAMLLYLAAWRLAREPGRERTKWRALLAMPLAVYALAGIAVVAEYVVPAASLQRWYRTIPACGDGIVLAVAALTVATLIAGFCLMRQAAGEASADA